MKKMIFLVLLCLLTGCSRHAQKIEMQPAGDKINMQLQRFEKEKDIEKREAGLKKLLGESLKELGSKNRITIFIKVALVRTLFNEGKNYEAAGVLSDLEKTPAEILPRFDTTRLEISSIKAEHLHNSAKLAEAAVVYRNALEISDRNFGSDSIQSGKICLSLASLEKETGNFNKAKEYIARAYVSANKNPGDTEFNISGIADTESELYIDLGDFQRSHQAALIALKDDESHPERGVMPVIRDLNDLGIHCQTHGKNEDAVKYLDRSLSLLRKIPPPEKNYDHHLYSFEAHLYLFCAAHSKGDKDAAEEHLNGVLQNLNDMTGSRKRSPQTESVVFGMALHVISDISLEANSPGSLPSLVQNLKEQVTNKNYDEASATIKEILKEYKKGANRDPAGLPGK